jgi:DNA-binding beta-propeller fold protein YncE
MQTHAFSTCPRPSSIAVAAGLVSLLSAGASAQAYSTAVVARGLLRPTGIVAAGDGTLWITEVPDPGQGGARNTVAQLDAMGRKTVLVAGEPQPTNLARAQNGDLFWTCLSAGVVQRFRNATRTTILRNLDDPSGMAVSGDGQLYFTQVPTPGQGGMVGGRNTVNAWTSGGGIVTVSMGEPEPRDVAVDAAGNLYWTCKSAGVILRRDAATGAIAPVLRGLEEPNGIAADGAGAIYFTEVPTPGVNGANGGRNRVSRYLPRTKTLTVIDFGDPEPTDVAVTADGGSVYWTCSSAGVVVRATPARAPITLSTMSPLGMGRPTPLLLRASEQAGRAYVAASSLGLGPLALRGETLALAPDALFVLSAGGASPALFAGYVGLLDGAGAASAAIFLPLLAELRGLAVTTAYVVLDGSSPAGLLASDTLYLVVD